MATTQIFRSTIMVIFNYLKLHIWRLEGKGKIVTVGVPRTLPRELTSTSPWDWEIHTELTSTSLWDREIPTELTNTSLWERGDTNITNQHVPMGQGDTHRTDQHVPMWQRDNAYPENIIFCWFSYLKGTQLLEGYLRRQRKSKLTLYFIINDTYNAKVEKIYVDAN